MHAVDVGSFMFSLLNESVIAIQTMDRYVIISQFDAFWYVVIRLNLTWGTKQTRGRMRDMTDRLRLGIRKVREKRSFAQVPH